MRMLQVSILLLVVNLLIPTILFQCSDLSSEEIICALMEDFSEEEEEDSESNTSAEDSLFDGEWQVFENPAIHNTLFSTSSYVKNNAFTVGVAIDVKTRPPRISEYCSPL